MTIKKSLRIIFIFCTVIPLIITGLFLYCFFSDSVKEMPMLISVFIFIALTSLFLTWMLGSSLTHKITDPVMKLKCAMKEAAHGNLDVRCNIPLNNEIGDLCQSFNTMLHIIQSSHDDLTSIHDQLRGNEEELRANYNHIEYLAYHDTLTNLPNKLYFNNRVNSILSSASNNRQKHAVFFVDLDNFKTINDTLGHNYGDDLLQQTAWKLNSLLGENDLLSRAGGDEFLLFKYGISVDSDASRFAEAILAAFRKPFNLEDEIIYVSMSIGIAIYPENGLTFTSLVKNSDIAMYKSKDTGKNKFTLFSRSIEEEICRSAEILEILRHCIENKEIYLMYQPQIEIKQNLITGYEALMRIYSPLLGSITPDEFIPIAEESGLIVELGTWVLRKACLFNKSLMNSGLPPCPVSVNISSIQLNNTEFMSTLKLILEETGLQPQYLELEITENTLASSLTDAGTLLNNLRSLGVKFSLDDFGTGNSSLNYLTNLPINTLKIDKSFVDNICSNIKDSFIAESIIDLAHKLDIKVVAEGVEDQDQFRLLEERHCDKIQGFLFSRPLMPEKLVSLLN